MASVPTSKRGPPAWRGVAVPVMVGAFALGIAVVGALLLGNDQGVDSVNVFVETLSGRSGSFLGGLGLPLAFAFAAGMVAAVNPCGFAMLPAYLGLYLGSGEGTGDRTDLVQHLGRALLVGAMVTSGFVLLFGIVGLVIGVGARSVVGDVSAWLGLVIGVLLTSAGAWLLGGGKLYTRFASQAAAKMGDPSRVSPRGYFVFGLSYGTASLGCTLPVFLLVVGTTTTASGIPTAVGQFFLYALGMGLVIMVLTVGMALFKGAMVRQFAKVLRYVQPVSAALVLVAGSFIVYYWLTIGGVDDSIRNLF